MVDGVTGTTTVQLAVVEAEAHRRCDRGRPHPAASPPPALPQPLPAAAPTHIQTGCWRRSSPLQQRRHRGHGRDGGALFPSCDGVFHSSLRRPSHAPTADGFPIAEADAAASPSRRRLPRPSPHPYGDCGGPPSPHPDDGRGGAPGLRGWSTSAAAPFPSRGGALLGAIHAVSRLLPATCRVLAAPATPHLSYSTRPELLAPKTGVLQSGDGRKAWNSGGCPWMLERALTSAMFQEWSSGY
ncbi:uncharacterized protein [Miscanthus floridulus]|uniref:uncharacterized protein n=1 Tax=Miscanthus floridulus TaxID=154761 RepID=UPI00345A9EFA